MKTPSTIEGDDREQRPVVAVQRQMDAAVAVTDGDIVLAAVNVSASPPRVITAMMTPECERWWGAPGTYTVESWRAELVPGGTWSVIIRLPDGTPLSAGGEFLEIHDNKIVQTRRYYFPHPTLGNRTTTVTTHLTPADIGTRIVVRHEGFDSCDAAIEHAGGWERLLDWLRQYMRNDVRDDG